MWIVFLVFRLTINAFIKFVRIYDNINMFVNLDSKVVNVGLRFLQLGCQIAVAYWAVAIDGY